MEDDERVQGKPSAAQRSVRAQTEEMEFSWMQKITKLKWLNLKSFDYLKKSGLDAKLRLLCIMNFRNSFFL